MADLNGFVDEYFIAHLDHKFWIDAESATKIAVVKMATNDINSCVGCGSIDLENTALCSAIAEQAVFLIRNHESLAENKIEVGSNIGGKLSDSSKVISKNAAISHRAERLLPQAIEYFQESKNTFPGFMRINRG